MIIQATPYGTKKEEPFAFTYSGDFTDERVDGIGDVTLNTSGQLVIPEQTKIPVVTVLIQGAGGGAACWTQVWAKASAGGGGGYQTVEVELSPGIYDIVIGAGGAAINLTSGNGTHAASSGGATLAFGCTCTGGSGGTISNYIANCSGGVGGLPNGSAGGYNAYGSSSASGGSPNGGSVVNSVAQPGGNGLVRITFS